MSIVTVTLLPDTERELRKRAVSVGVSLETYLGRLAEKDVSNGTLAHEATFDVIGAPIRHAFKTTGMTDADITELVQEAREEVWKSKTGVSLRLIHC